MSASKHKLWCERCNGDHWRKDCPVIKSGALIRETKEAVRCHLHNTGSTLAGNTQTSDIEWFARWLYGASNFGAGWTETLHWSLNNAKFEKLGLIPDRPWTGYRWETLPPKRKAAWLKLSRLCLYALPHICERIVHRFMEQAQGLRDSQEWPNRRNSATERTMKTKHKTKKPTPTRKSPFAGVTLLDAARNSLKEIFNATLINSATAPEDIVRRIVDLCNHKAQRGLRLSEDAELKRMTIGAANLGRYGYDPTP